MATYGSKTAAAEAFKLGVDRYPAWFTEAACAGTVVHHCDRDSKKADWYSARTPNGIVTVENGDYAVRNAKGEITLVKADVFEAARDAVRNTALKNGQPRGGMYNQAFRDLLTFAVTQALLSDPDFLARGSESYDDKRRTAAAAFRLAFDFAYFNATSRRIHGVK